MIYFVQAISGGPIKIGCATDVARRLSELQVANPVKLRVLGVMEGDRGQETTLHERFKDSAMRGEWYSEDPALLEFIATQTHQITRARKIAKSGFRALIGIFEDRLALATRWNFHLPDPLTVNVPTINCWHHRDGVPGWSWGGFVAAAADLGHPEINIHRLGQAALEARADRLRVCRGAA